jgi:hypothetical protein
MRRSFLKTQDCKVDTFSSRICERGTKSCVVEHGEIHHQLTRELTREVNMNANEKPKMKLDAGGLYELFEAIVLADEETPVGGKEARRRGGQLSLTRRVSSNEYVDARTQAYFQGFLLGIACITEGAIDLNKLKDMK